MLRIMVSYGCWGSAGRCRWPGWPATCAGAAAFGEAVLDRPSRAVYRLSLTTPEVSVSPVTTARTRYLPRGRFRTRTSAVHCPSAVSRHPGAALSFLNLQGVVGHGRVRIDVDPEFGHVLHTPCPHGPRRPWWRWWRWWRWRSCQMAPHAGRRPGASHRERVDPRGLAFGVRRQGRTGLGAVTHGVCDQEGAVDWSIVEVVPHGSCSGVVYR